MEQFLSALLSGLQNGAIYGLIGLAYVTIYRSSGFLVLTHGEVVMVAGLVTEGMGVTSFPFALGAAVVSVAVGAALTTGLYLGPIRWMRDATPLRVIILSFGVALVLHSGARAFFGTEQRFPRALPGLPSTITLFYDRAAVRGQAIAVFAALVVLSLLLSWWFAHGRFGRAARATGDDGPIAVSMGIPRVWVIAVSFAIGGGLAALAGFLSAPITGAVWNGGTIFGLKGLVAALAGGVERPLGPVIGGLLLGLAEQFASIYVVPGWTDAVAFGVLVIAVLIRARGSLETAR